MAKFTGQGEDFSPHGQNDIFKEAVFRRKKVRAVGRRRKKIGRESEDRMAVADLTILIGLSPFPSALHADVVGHPCPASPFKTGVTSTSRP